MDQANSARERVNIFGGSKDILSVKKNSSKVQRKPKIDMPTSDIIFFKNWSFLIDSVSYFISPFIK